MSMVESVSGVTGTGGVSVGVTGGVGVTGLTTVGVAPVGTAAVGGGITGAGVVGAAVETAGKALFAMLPFGCELPQLPMVALAPSATNSSVALESERRAERERAEVFSIFPSRGERGKPPERSEREQRAASKETAGPGSVAFKVNQASHSVPAQTGESSTSRREHPARVSFSVHLQLTWCSMANSGRASPEGAVAPSSPSGVDSASVHDEAAHEDRNH